MNPFLENLGLGALFAAVALPMLAAAVGDVSGKDPGSRHAALLMPLVLAAPLFAVPWLREVFRFAGEVAVTPEVLSQLSGSPLNEVAEASRWSASSALAVLFLSLVGAATLRHLVRWARLQRVLWRAKGANEPTRLEVERQASRLGIASPRVLVSSETSVPFVVGALRPRLVWPAQLLERLSAQEQELVLRHELSHLARGDHRLAPMLVLLQLVFPFHPTARRLIRELAVAREEAVDACIAPEHVHAYAQLLVTVAAFASQGPQLEVLGMADASLKRRIATLASSEPRPLARFARVTVLGLTLISGLIVAPRAVAHPANTGHAVTLEIGRQTVITMAGTKRVAIGDPSICDVKTRPNDALELLGRSKGTTSLLIWTADGVRHDLTITVE